MLTFNRGDTFSFLGTASLSVNGSTQVDMSGWTVTASIELSNLITEPVEAGWVDASISKIYIRCLDTNGWSDGHAVVNVSFIRADGSKTTVKTSEFTVA